MNRRRPIVTIAALIVSIWGANLSFPAAASAQQDGTTDRGTFTHYLRGARVGEERFVITEERAGEGGPLLRARAELNRKVDGETSRIMVALEVMGAEGTPRRYEMVIEGSGAATIVAVLVRDRLRLNVQSAAGREMRQFLVKERALILDPLLAHQYYFAAKLVRSGETADVTLFVPYEKAELAAKLTDLGISETMIGQIGHSLRHITITAPGQNERHVWLHDDKVVKAEIPADGWSAVRNDAANILNEERGSE